MRIAVVQFPGSNCERETALAIKRAGMEAIEFLWNEPREKLREMDGFVIVGGFSYEDRSRAGIIAALDPVMEEIKAQDALGKPILGICNGAQILVETGLVPGLENNKVAMALAENKRIVADKIVGTGFFNTWIYMRVSDTYQRNAFTKFLTTKNILKVPIAHAEGRFMMSTALLEEIKAHGLNVFQYCDAEGAVVPHFPVNPNGSIDNIAAISNKRGNVMAMMPHPERTSEGDAIFRSMRAYIEEKHIEQTTSLYYYPRKRKLPVYQSPAGSVECIVELMITDNQAITVQNTLRQQGFTVTVTCQRHWEIQADDEDTIQRIKASGVLFNDRKEKEVKSKTAGYLVRPKEDLLGQQKLQILKNHLHMQSVHHIRQGVLWFFSFEQDANVKQACPEEAAQQLSRRIDSILNTHIIYNPYAHDCYQYE